MVKIYDSLLCFTCVCSQDYILEDAYSRKKIDFFFVLVCSLPSNKRGQVNKEKKKYSVMTKIGRKIRDVNCINLQIFKGVVLQQHCPYLELTLLQDYASQRKHNIWVL